MNKEQLVWTAKKLGLAIDGTIPELERRIAIYNTAEDAKIIAEHDPDAARIMNLVAPLKHQLAARAELADVDDATTNDYYVEEKYDGMRAWLIIDGARKYIYSRHYTKDMRLNNIANINNVSLGNIPHLELTILDVELYVSNASISRHDRLGLSIAAFSTYSEVTKKARPIVLDALMINHVDVSYLSYAERRERMTQAGLQQNMSPQFSGNVHDIFDKITIDEKGEGLVLKQKDCQYLQGQRAGWHKLKVGYADGNNDYSVIITGMADRGRGRNLGLVGSVTVSDMNGQPLGEVGTFTDYVRQQLTDESTGLLKPWLIGKQIEVRAMELTRDKKLRHASFVRFLT